MEKKSWWGKTELYRQSLTSPFHIKCCTIFCRQLSRIFLPENRSGLGRWYILETVVCFRFSCSSRGDNVHSLHQLSLRSYDGRTLWYAETCSIVCRCLKLLSSFWDLKLIRLMCLIMIWHQNTFLSKARVEVDTFLHLTHHHDHLLTVACDVKNTSENSVT